MNNNKSNSMITINANIENVWYALTNEDMLTKWYAPESPWHTPMLKKGEKMLFILMPNVHNSLTEELPMNLIIEEVIPYKEFSFSIESIDGTISFIMEEQVDSIKVVSNTAGFDESLANLKALVEGDVLPNM